MIETNKIYNENNRVTLALMPINIIDLVVTSPPYDDLRQYNGYSFDFEYTARELYRVIKPGGVLDWVVGDKTKNGCESLTSFRQALYFVDECGFRLNDTMIYKRPCAPQPHTPRYEQRFEYMFVFSKGKISVFNPIQSRTLYFDNRKQKGFHRKKSNENKFKKGKMSQSEFCKIGNIWNLPNTGGKNDKIAHKHPACFPEELAKRHIYSWSNPGDLVYDPFMGSGTVAKMALVLGRRFVGSEVSAEYCEIANKRIAPFLHSKRVFGKSFILNGKGVLAERKAPVVVQESLF